MAQSLTSHRVRPMNIHVIGNSVAGRKYIGRGGIPDLEPVALAPGLPSTQAHNLKFHGGKTIQSLTFTNFFVGSNTSWAASDISSIDHALAGAMSEPTLNNVMVQYFAAMPTSTFRPSVVLPGAAPATMSQGDVEQLVTDLNTSGRFDGFDLTSTVFNFMLPRGTVLNDNPAKGSRQGLPPGEEHHRRGVPDEDEANSLNGLGGYHGSVIIGTSTIYYAVGVFSETRNGQTNGIPVFDQPWKNVVATFYHELNEARTDPDVEKVIAGARSSLLGWASRQGEECGDFPVFEANPLTEVFKEVPLTSGGTAPVQFQYSNAADGPEGPISHPHPPARHEAPRVAVVA
jgi:hypothetical protein